MRRFILLDKASSLVFRLLSWSMLRSMDRCSTDTAHRSYNWVLTSLCLDLLMLLQSDFAVLPDCNQSIIAMQFSTLTLWPVFLLLLVQAILTLLGCRENFSFVVPMWIMAAWFLVLLLSDARAQRRAHGGSKGLLRVSG